MRAFTTCLAVLLISGMLSAEDETESDVLVSVTDSEWFLNPPEKVQVLSKSDQEYTEARINIAKQKKLLVDLNAALAELRILSSYGPDVSGIINFDASNEDNLNAMLKAMQHIPVTTGRLTLAQLTQESAGNEYTVDIPTDEPDDADSHIPENLGVLNELEKPAEEQKAESTSPPAEVNRNLEILFAEAPNANHDGKIIYTLGDSLPADLYIGSGNPKLQLISVKPLETRRGKLTIDFVFEGNAESRVYPL